MSKKLQDYVKRLKKFLKENYIIHPLKMYNYSSKTVEIKENYFVIETNTILMKIQLDLICILMTGAIHIQELKKCLKKCLIMQKKTI